MRRAIAWALCTMVLAGPVAAVAEAPEPVVVPLSSDVPPGPRCYRKVDVEAVYETSRRLVRKARLVHDEAEDGQIKLTHFPAIYVEEKTLLEPAYVLLQEVKCTRRVLRKAKSLPQEQCRETRGCRELDPGAALPDF